MFVFLSIAILVYFTILGISYLTLFMISLKRIVGKYQEIHFSHINRSLVLEHGLAVTVLMPVRDNQDEIITAIDAVLKNDYPNMFLIVINDDSSDRTLNRLMLVFELEKTTKGLRHLIPSSQINNIYQSRNHPRLIVIDKQHEQTVASAADALNVGLNFCRTPLFVTVDSDTVIAKDAIVQLLYRYFSTAYCVAVGGDIFIPDEHLKPGNIPSDSCLGVQVVEYLRSFVYGHEFWSSIGGALCHSGALTLFETKSVVDLGGFDAENFSYDAEIIMHLHDHYLSQHLPYRIRYAPAAIAWSSQSTKIKDLMLQRNRWQRGILRSIAKHIHMLFNPKYGRVGLLGLPFYILFEALGPVVEGIAYLSLVYALLFHKLNFIEVSWFILLAWGYLYILTVASVLLNYMTLNQYHLKKDLFKILWLNLLDVIFYRPLRSLCCLFSSLQYFLNKLLGKPL